MESSTTARTFPWRLPCLRPIDGKVLSVVTAAMLIVTISVDASRGIGPAPDRSAHRDVVVLDALRASAPEVVTGAAASGPSALPASLAHGISVGDEVRLIVGNGTHRGVDIAPGLRSYGEIAPGVVAVAEAGSTGGRVLAVVSRPMATGSSVEYDLDLPPDAVTEVDPAGGVTVRTAQGSLRAELAPPWARDARGTDLPTAYLLRGRTRLVQVVDTTGAVFPVVADPAWDTTWKLATCVAVLTTNSIVAYKLLRALRGVRTIRELARLLVRGGVSRERLLIMAEGILGIDAVVKACS